MRIKSNGKMCPSKRIWLNVKTVVVHIYVCHVYNPLFTPFTFTWQSFSWILPITGSMRMLLKKENK